MNFNENVKISYIHLQNIPQKIYSPINNLKYLNMLKIICVE